MEATLIYVTITLFVVSAVHAVPKNVFQFEIRDEAWKLGIPNKSDWRKSDPFPARVEVPPRKDKLGAEMKSVLNHFRKSPTTVRLTGYKNCGNSSDIVQVDSVTFPDTIHAGDIIVISVKFTVKEPIKAPIKASAELKEKAGATWIDIPCIEEIVGTCNYNDLCNTMGMIPQCPDFLTKQGFNCKCPIANGTYSLNNQQVGPIPTVVPKGEYSFKATATAGGRRVTCLELTATVSDTSTFP